MEKTDKPPRTPETRRSQREPGSSTADRLVLYLAAVLVTLVAWVVPLVGYFEQAMTASKHERRDQMNRPASTPKGLPVLIPREILFGNPERAIPRLSPDGKYLAYLAPDDKNVLQVWLRTVGQADDRKLTADKKRGIRIFYWTYDGRHLIYAQDSDGDENWHLFGVDVESRVVRDQQYVESST